jgi:hypothetical protein
MDNGTPEELIQQAERLDNTAEYYWEHGAFGIAKELYSRANNLRLRAAEKSHSLS